MLLIFVIEQKDDSGDASLANVLCVFLFLDISVHFYCDHLINTM